MSDATPTPTAPPAGASAKSTWVDPYGAFNFKLMIGNLAVGHFTEVSGPKVTIDTVEYREAGQSQVVHHIPTIASYETLYLRQGLTRTTELWDWFVATLNGEYRRLAVSIILLDSRGTTPVVQWNLFDSLPVSFTGGDLRAIAREVYIHEFGLKYEGIERVGAGNA
ncbi:phage tail protein [Microbacterium sp. zg.Y625]|uniref:phage tail protein n=1 Tax=Microbacterium jiangjiandongii TaxID=3049071 RepID=UPI00214D0BEC|nr:MULTISPECIES: phage tail protein [unclassified Microbacterium]MCR2792314.1 phage tail protein [Microbacterium sp. zg.Y625]WIM25109.1 phage tail protein [Microbacterium sp. zg-Y625]